MKYFAVFVALFMALASFNTCSAVSEPICFLELPGEKGVFLKKGSQRTYGLNGVCMVATCGPDYNILSVPC